MIRPFLGAFFFFAISSLARAQGNTEPMHWSGDHQLWDRKANRIDLDGHAMVRQQGETLTADKITLDMTARTLTAKGNCVYIAADSVIYGDEIYFNFDTRTGSIVNGRVSNNKFTLAGERINKLGEGKFQTHWGEYSTCHDCPQSWTFLAEDVDMQFDGYAFMSNVTTKVKDAPALWMPYLIVPIKNRRQTGVLFPRMGFGTVNGTQFVLPFFWAINRSSDMTIGAGTYSKRGTHAEWQGRYALTDRSVGQADVKYQKDKAFDPRAHRYGIEIAQTQEFPWGIVEKLQFSEVSDSRYAIDIDGGSRANKEAFLVSDLSLSKATSDFGAYITAKRSRNLLVEDAAVMKADGKPDIREQYVRFDPRTVQVYPSALITTNDRFLLGLPVAGGLTMGISNFTRTSGPFDKDVLFDPNDQDKVKLKQDTFYPGYDPIRKAVRASVSPTMYTTLRPWDRLSLVPSLQYRNYFYSFPGSGAGNIEYNVSNLHRSYLLFQMDLSTQLERVYETSNRDIPRRKHLIRPILTYSNIPTDAVKEDETHPFMRQIKYAKEKQVTGYNFDSYDIVPLDEAGDNESQYFTPLGNSLTYGFTTIIMERNGRLYDRDGREAKASYTQPIEFSMGETINFREYSKPEENRRPFGRIFSNLLLSFPRFTSSTTHYYYPYLTVGRNTVTTSNSILFAETRKGLLLYQRSLNIDYNYNIRSQRNSVSGGVSYSLNDYILPTVAADYDILQDTVSSLSARLLIQSPSQCWRFAIASDYNFTRKGTNVAFDLTFNLTGDGFGGVLETAEGVAGSSR